MKHYLNVCDINGAEVAPVDVITFGSPCQDLSVAGKRAGLKHTDKGDEETTRSGLFMEAVRIIKEMRQNDRANGRSDEFCRPRFAVWENVQGAFSSNKGEDFRVVLEELCRVKEPSISIPRPKNGKWNNAGSIIGDGWSIAWRVLDAQYWGVPQRRKRIFLVADFGGQCSEEILFKQEILRRDNSESEQERKSSSGSPSESTGLYDSQVYDARGNGYGNLCSTLTGDHQNRITDYTNVVCSRKCTHPHNVNEPQKCEHTETADTLNVFDNSEKRTPIICVQERSNQIVVPYSIGGVGSNEMGIKKSETSRTLDVVGIRPDSNQGGIAVVTVYMGGGKSAVDVLEEKSPTLTTTHYGSPDVAYSINHQGGNVEQIIEETCGTLTASMNSSGNNKMSVAYGLDRSSFNQGINAQYDFTVEKELMPTVVAKGPGAVCYAEGINGSVSGTLDSCYYKGCGEREGKEREVVAIGFPCNWDGSQTSPTLTKNNASGSQRMPDKDNFNCVIDKVEIEYIVRRLTPTECARLQGFPDRWGWIEHKDDFTDEEYAFWLNVRNTHAEINGKAIKNYSKDQMLKWYNGLHSDSSEYKMWGNGVALPCVRFVLKGIAEHGAKTLGSLFDGSGGFPLAGALNGISPIWASEIEPYPIAVTMSRFKEESL